MISASVAVCHSSSFCSAFGNFLRRAGRDFWLSHYFSIALRNKPWAIFGPDVAKPAPVRAKRV
jgi:hypothetical protein